MKRVLVIFLESGFIMLAGYQAYCWAVHLNSYLLFALPLLVLYATGYALSYWVGRRMVALGVLPLRIEFLDKGFLMGGLVLNVLAFLCLLMEGTGEKHY